MLQTLRDLFDALVPHAGAADDASARRNHQLATAVLRVEVMRADREIDPAERATILEAICTRFGLSAQEGAALLELAGQTSREATDYFAFTSRINEAYPMEQKIAIVETMWRVAYADGRLSAHENHLMRKIGDLLYIPHGAYVAAKLRARGAHGDGPPQPAPEPAPT
jgi:uncharacterized tellurite resistance protein B-like protein